MDEVKLDIPTFPFRFCYKKRKNTITEATLLSDGSVLYTGLDDPSIMESIRGKSFNSTSMLMEAIHPNGKKNFDKYLYYLDEQNNMTNITFKDTKDQLQKSNNTEEGSEPTVSSTTHLKKRKREKISASNPTPVSLTSNNSTLTPQSIFNSISTIENLYPPDDKDLKRIEKYDKVGCIKSWMTPEQILHGNTKWNPIASCYIVFYYIFKTLRWPLEESRIIINYHTNAVKFSKVIPIIYKKYGISEQLKNSDILVQLLVWCIASMNSFGIIRPIIFEGSTEKAFRLTSLCAVKQRYERTIYYVAWPFRTDTQNLYVLHDQTKIKTIKIKDTFLLDLGLEKGYKKILKKIPDWVYKIVKV